ncbi:Uncharacterised protein [Vibrio cholerae]|nr:Uncharacterised protein [Vibrio cholerae]
MSPIRPIQTSRHPSPQERRFIGPETCSIMPAV